MTKLLLFDMDGTLFDLYGELDWLPKLRREETGLFKNLKPLWEPSDVWEICQKLVAQGWRLGVNTWLPMGASLEYEQLCSQEKLESIHKHFPFLAGEFYPLTYGTPKQFAPFKRAQLMVLVDDNAEVRSMWNTPKARKSLDPIQDNDLQKTLYQLLDFV